MTGPARLLCTAVALLCGALPAFASEERFTYVDSLPMVQGELQRSLSNDEAESGLRFTQEVYRRDLEAGSVLTFVMTARCLRGTARDKPQRPFIVALRYVAKHPQSFAVAGLHDIYKEVYVEDLEGRFRRYEDMNGAGMVELTHGFKPLCPGI